ncbi:MAG: AI-2E family transporter [Chromatiaceae bacterium]|nr:AI-2E family transporter [Gammaproteobacteria bacterium]MCP5303965.1 AI-2E family transporter [Chromatiaceae bacterium]MCP5313692.1 AI-2E family transporter [Chromatiaceae bacterium]
MTDAYRLWLLVSLSLLAWLLYLLSPILMPFVFSALLAYLGDPLVDRLEARGLKRTPAVALVFCVLTMLAILLLLLLVPRLEAQITQLLQKLPGYLEWLRGHLLPRLQALLPGEVGDFQFAMLPQALAKHWREAGGVLAGLWSSVSSSGMVLVGWLANLVLVPVLTFYLLRDWDHLIAGIHALLPRRNEVAWVRLARESDEVLGAFLRGQLLVMAALGVIYTTGLWLVGLDFALLLGMLAGVVSFVPYLGLIVGILVAGLASVLQSQGIADLPWVVVVFVVGQVIEGTFLTPRLVGERIGLHPVAVIFAVMAGGQLYGFFGILLALPVAAVAMVLVRHLVARYRSSTLYGEASPAEVPPDQSTD